MGFTSLICTYLYGTYKAIQTALESYVRIAKNLIKKVDTLATTIMNVVRTMINSSLSTLIKIVKQYEKELIDMIVDASGLNKGAFHDIWCNQLWNCVALLVELLKSDSWLQRKIIDYLNRHCIRPSRVIQALDVIALAAEDFNTFRSTICNAGFTVEFGISYIKRLFASIKSVIEEYLSFLERSLKRLRLAVEEYLNIIIDWGIMEYLEQLMTFFSCVFDDSTSCAEIATASNYYQNVLSKLKLERKGDGYDISEEYRNSIYGSLEGGISMCRDFEEEINNAMSKCVDPNKLRKADMAVNLSNHIIPGGMSWEDLREGNWENHYLAKLYSRRKEQLKEAWREKFNQEETITNIVNNIEYDDDGHIYAINGCRREQLDPFPGDPEDPPTERVNVITDVPVNHSILLSPDGNIYTLWEAALEIKDGTSDFAKECIAYADLLNDWRKNADGVKRYNEPVFN